MWKSDVSMWKSHEKPPFVDQETMVFGGIYVTLHPRIVLLKLDSPSIQWFEPTNACTPRCRKKSSGPFWAIVSTKSSPVRSDDFIVTLWYATMEKYIFYISYIYIYISYRYVNCTRLFSIAMLPAATIWFTFQVTSTAGHPLGVSFEFLTLTYLVRTLEIFQATW